MNRQKLYNILNKDNSWIVVKSGQNTLNIVKQFGKKTVKTINFSIVCLSKGLHIEHPEYSFKSTVSHFSAIKEDKRLSLNKTFLRSIILSLKKLGVWDSVTNKDFLQINKNNKKSDKSLVKKELKDLLK